MSQIPEILDAIDHKPHVPEGIKRSDFYDVTNFEAVYADVRDTWQDPIRARLLHKALGGIFKPEVHFGDGVEDRMRQELANGAQIAIAFTHGKMLDPPHIAAMAEHNDVFDPMLGKTMIGAKVGLFKVPVLGELVPDLGAYPIWRHKDTRDESLAQEEQDQVEAIRIEAGKASVALEIAGFNQGLHSARHVEGTRNRTNPLEVQKVYDGYGRVVTGVDPSVDILMVAAAFHYGRYYGHNMSETWRYPTMYLHIPENQRRVDHEEVTRTIKPALQQAMNSAVELHQTRPIGRVINALVPTKS